jgi:NADH-ubiquinone oxidoreductase chain 6
MLNLYLLDELTTNGFFPNILDIMSLFIIFSSIFVIISKNPIVSVLFLIVLFGGVSSYLISLGLNFIGFSYLIVYIGAVSILFLFILMLINIRISELQSNTKNSLPLAILINVFLSFIFTGMIPYSSINLYNNSSKLTNDITSKTLEDDLYFVTSNTWDMNFIETSHISSIGNILYSSHNLWLILVSFILLIAMIGAIVITTASRKSN